MTSFAQDQISDVDHGDESLIRWRMVMMEMKSTLQHWQVNDADAESRRANESGAGCSAASRQGDTRQINSTEFDYES